MLEYQLLGGKRLLQLLPRTVERLLMAPTKCNCKKRGVKWARYKYKKNMDLNKN